MLLNDALPYIVAGLVLVTLVDTIGSIASRKFNFNYTYLTPPSLIAYTLAGYYASANHGLHTALVTSFVIGLYDATIGLKLSIILKANTGLNEEEERMVFNPLMMFVVIGIAVLFGFIGHLLI